jgi:hypothetical protein
VQKIPASTLFNRFSYRRLLFVWYLETKRQGINVNNAEELQSEIPMIFQGIQSNEPKKSFDRWIERCQ